MERIQKQISDKNEYGTIIFMILLLIGLYWTSSYSYLGIAVLIGYQNHRI